MKPLHYLLPALFLMTMGAGCKTAQAPVTEPEPVRGDSIVVNMSDKTEARQSGSAVFTEVDSVMEIDLSLLNAPEFISQPAALHEGTCSNLGSKFDDLPDLRDGELKTFYPQRQEVFKKNLPMSLIVRASTEEETIVSCGDLVF